MSPNPEPVPPSVKPTLLDVMRAVLRFKRMSPRTGEVYLARARRFILGSSLCSVVHALK